MCHKFEQGGLFVDYFRVVYDDLVQSEESKTCFYDAKSNFNIDDSSTLAAGVRKAAAERNVCRFPGCTYGDDAPLTVIYMHERVRKGHSIFKDTLHCLIVIIAHTMQGLDVKFRF